MKKYHLRVHVRVMNRGQWEALNEVRFSDEVQSLIGDVTQYIDGRSLIIDKTVSYNGFLFLPVFFEITDYIKENVGQCLLIGDFRSADGKKDASYVCDIADLSESELEMPEKLFSTDIKNIEAWMKARGKTTPKTAISYIQSFYGNEPQPAMFGPWSIEKEIQLRHNVFSKATLDEIVQIMKENISRVYKILGEGESTNGICTILISLAGTVGAANGRKANDAEKRLFTELIHGLPDDVLQSFISKMEEPFGKDQLDAVSQVIKLSPLLCSSILDFVFCFIYADKKTNARDAANLQKLGNLLSIPMSAVFVAMQFGEEISHPPVDYVSFVSGIDADTAVGMGGSDGMLYVGSGSDSVGMRVLAADLSDDAKEKSPRKSASKKKPITATDPVDYQQEAEEQQRREIKKAADTLVEQSKDFLKGLNQAWQQFLQDYQDSISSHTFESEFELQLEIMKLAEAQRIFAGKYEALFDGLNEAGEKLYDLGMEQSEIIDIAYLLDDIVDDIGELSLDFDMYGNASGRYGSGTVSANAEMRGIVRSWKNKKSKAKYSAPKKKSATSSKTSSAPVPASKSASAPAARKKPKSTAASKSELARRASTNEKIEAKILESLKGDTKAYSAWELSSKIKYASISTVRISQVAKEMAEKGLLLSDNGSPAKFALIEAIYEAACKVLDTAKDKQKVEDAIKELQRLGDYKDSKERIKQALENVKLKEYQALVSQYEKAVTRDEFAKLAKKFDVCGDYRDSKEYREKCEDRVRSIDIAHRQYLKRYPQKAREKKILTARDETLARLKKINDAFSKKYILGAAFFFFGTIFELILGIGLEVGVVVFFGIVSAVCSVYFIKKCMQFISQRKEAEMAYQAAMEEYEALQRCPEFDPSKDYSKP